MLGLLIGVVSATATPAAIEEAVARFLVGFLDSLDSMAPDAYARNVAACAANRLVDDHNMQEEATRYFAEIEAGLCESNPSRNSTLTLTPNPTQAGLYEFGRAEQEAAAIHLVTQAGTLPLTLTPTPHPHPHPYHHPYHHPHPHPHPSPAPAPAPAPSPSPSPQP